MKKILAIVLALTMVFALCACGAKEEAPAAADNAAKVYAVEAGSAGEAAAKADANLSVGYKAVEDMAGALLEVKSGTADACVIDYVMAKSLLSK